MKRFILTVAVLLIGGTLAEAGPIRDRLAARFARPSCGSCQPAQAVAPGPVRQAVGTAMVSAGGAVADLGQVVQGDGYTPIRLASPLTTRPVCSGGVCR